MLGARLVHCSNIKCTGYIHTVQKSSTLYIAVTLEVSGGWLRRQPAPGTPLSSGLGCEDSQDSRLERPAVLVQGRLLAAWFYHLWVGDLWIQEATQCLFPSTNSLFTLKQIRPITKQQHKHTTVDLRITTRHATAAQASSVPTIRGFPRGAAIKDGHPTL